MGSNESWLRRGAQLLFVERGLLGISFILALAGALLGVYEPLLLMRLFDVMGQADGFELALYFGGMLAALEISRQIIATLGNWISWKARLRVHHRVLEAATIKLHGFGPSEIGRDGTGALITRLDRGIQGFLSAFTEITLNLVPSLVFLIASAVLMFQIEPRLAVLALLCAPLPAIVGIAAVPAQARRDRALLERWERIYARLKEVLSGILTVRSFVQEERERSRFLREVNGANSIVVRGVAVDSSVGALQGIATAFARLAILLYGTWLVVRGETTVGTVVAFLTYVHGLLNPVRALSGIYGTVQRARVALDALRTIMDAPERVPDAPGAVYLAKVRGEVQFRGLSFRYPGSTRNVLDEIDLTAAPGETVALVGASGAGKTTLMALLQRFYDPSEGEVLIDGRDIRTIRQTSLRQNIGVVFQEPFLFDDTVRDNIAYGCPDKSLDEIIAAAQDANAHDFIMQMPDGYDTRVGEQGCRLSAGERQRVAIARALLKDPAILILDEATSALDAESQALVQEALERLLEGRTAFIIAHRLATVVDADRIAVLRNGRIIEQDRHLELLRAGGYYASLYERQFSPSERRSA